LRIGIIGLGEVGRALLEIIRGVYPETYGMDLNGTLPENLNFLHICYPYVEEHFITVTSEYVNRYNPEITIIESTIPPGTTFKILAETKKPICHSPVRGVHPYLKTGIFRFPKYIGSADNKHPEWALKVSNYYGSLGIRTKICRSALEVELGKLLELCEYSLDIAWQQEAYRICRSLGADYEETVTIQRNTYSFIQHPDHEFRRFPITPGHIGKHCCIPAVKMLNKVYPSQFLEAILNSNNKRLKELIENPSDPYNNLNEPGH
jgi:UDP-N-acetyl-D-mannosaminuronate dehydrogenase